MTVTNVLTRLREYGDAIAGINVEFRYIPHVIQDGELPAWIVLPGEGAYSVTEYGNETLISTRTYRILVLTGRAGQGSQSQGQIVVEPYLDSVPQYFAARPGLPSLTDALDVLGEVQVPISDTGYIVINYPQQSDTFYHGIEFRLTVRELTTIDYRG